MFKNIIQWILITSIFLPFICGNNNFMEFKWGLHENSNQNIPFPTYLSQNYQSSDFFYVFTGDTQYWYDCTYDNKNCLQETACKTTAGTDNDVKLCQKKHGEYANRLQQKSIAALDTLIRNPAAGNNQLISGLVINGDLVMYGHIDEIDKLKDQWINYFQNMQIYLGLGNHDYSNNINQCANQECLNRILKYFITYTETNLHISLDYRKTVDNGKEIINGSLSYSWDKCTSSMCFHFIQLNYFPYYTRVIDSPAVQWQIRSSLKWLENDLDKNLHKPVIINFHAMDYSFTDQSRSEFKNFLSVYLKKGAKILALMFAHYHERVGVKEVWCFSGNDKRVPLIYSGSVPANNYLLLQFSTQSGTVKAVYQIHADNQTMNTVDKLEFNQKCTYV